MYYKSIIIVICSFGILLASSPFFNEKSQHFFNNSEKQQPSIYLVKNRPYSENDAEKKLIALSKFGFKWKQKKENGTNISYANIDEKKLLTYNSKKSLYRYSDRLLEGLTENDVQDKVLLKEKSKLILNTLLEENSSKYKFINEEYEYVVIRDIGKKQLNYISFRYVYTLDDRPILGATHNLLITLGKSGQLKECQISVPIIEKVNPVARKVKKSSMASMIRNYIKSEKYTKNKLSGPIKIEKTDVIDVVESYFCKKDNKKQVLSPHLTFFTIDSVLDDNSLRRENHISVDVNDIPNIKPEMIINYDKNPK